MEGQMPREMGDVVDGRMEGGWMDGWKNQVEEDGQERWRHNWADGT